MSRHLSPDEQRDEMKESAEMLLEYIKTIEVGSIQQKTQEAAHAALESDRQSQGPKTIEDFLRVKDGLPQRMRLHELVSKASTLGYIPDTEKFGAR